MPDAAMIGDQMLRREALRRLGLYAAAVALPVPVTGCAADEGEQTASADPLEPPPEPFHVPAEPEDERRFNEWVETLREEGLTSESVPLGIAAIRVGELALGTPYEAYTLEAYIRAGGSPVRTEPLTISLTRFDCVSLVESCLAVARTARRPAEEPTWDEFARAIEAMRYRRGEREGYTSRLHYFSEWLHDNEQRGLVRRLGEALGGEVDSRPLRFMSSNPDAYPALENPDVLEQIVAMERRLDPIDRWLIPTDRIEEVVPQLQTGDILAFGTAIEGLDVTHAAFAYRDTDDVLRVLHAPLSGGVVEITDSTVPEYVAAISRSTGILVGRPLDGPRA